MNSVWQDIKFGFRMLVKRPGLTLIAVLILALGIGANTTLFSLVNSILIYPLRIPEAERIMMVEPQWSNGNLNGSSSWPDYLDWEQRNTVFEELTAFNMCKPNLTEAGNPMALKGFHITANYFDVFNPKMKLGRGFNKEEMQGVTVISNRLWRTRFSCDPNIINKQIFIDKVPHTVVGVAGVMPEFLEEMSQIYLPIPKNDYARRGRDWHFLIVLGRLKKDVSLAQARDQMAGIGKQLSKEYLTNSEKGVYVGSVDERLISNIRPAFYILYGAVTLLLLVACANVSNLLMAKASARSRDIAIRQALGSGRGRIIRQLLIESLLLGLAGGAAGLLLGFYGLSMLRLITPSIQETGISIPGFAEAQIDTEVLLFTTLLAVLTSIVFGMMPAWQGSRFNVNKVLKETGSGLSIARGRHHTLDVLVVSQIALAFVLLVGAGLLVRSFVILQRTTPGFNANGLLAIQVNRIVSQDANSIKPAAFFYQVVEKFAALPGVESASAISIRPLSPENNNCGVDTVGIPGNINAESRVVTNDYFRCLGIPIHQGRSFSEQDSSTSQPVAIISKEFARQKFADKDPVGRVIRFWGKDRTIVGVVGDVKLKTLRAVGYKPFVYIPNSQSNTSEMTIFIRTKDEPVNLAEPARQIISEIDPYQPILNISSMSHLAIESVSLDRFCTIIIGTMAGVALLMAMVGLYAVMAFAVNERRNEVGIRIALGAQNQDILVLVIKKAFVLTIIGLIIGLAGAMAVSRGMASLLYNTSTWDPATFILVPLLLFGVAMLACYIPARRAAKIDPMEALRCE